jgi:putative DNA primase/helicase
VAAGNGKGVFLNTLSAALGDYAVAADMDQFTASQGNQHPTGLADLRGARLVLVQETEAGRALAEARIKALTGGDPIKARFMKRDFFTYQPTFKLVMAGNHRPVLRNPDDAMRRRLHLMSLTYRPPRPDILAPRRRILPPAALVSSESGSGATTEVDRGRCSRWQSCRSSVSPTR